MANNFARGTIRSLQTLSTITVGLLGGLLLCCVLLIVSSFLLAWSPNSVIDPGGGEPIHLAFLVIGLVGFFHFFLYLATVVFFLIWEHRAVSNLPQLQAEYLQFSPGWAVGWWFIPFANLVKPFQAMRELWTASDPEYDADLGFLSGNATAPTFMGFWWAFWLLANLTGWIAGQINDPQSLPLALIIANGVEIIAAALLIKLVLDIGKRQELRSLRLGTMQLSVPPPPTF